MDKVPHASHWGAYNALSSNGRVASVEPLHRDQLPSDLIYSVPDSVHSASRIDQPYVRNPNVLTSDVPTSHPSQSSSAQSCLVEIERWRGSVPELTIHMRPIF